MTPKRLLPWALRVAWGVLPFTAGPALVDALDGRSRAVELVASAGLWAVWAVTLLATLVPHPMSLTALRMATPAAAGAALVAAAEGHGSPLAVSTTMLAVAVAFLPETGSYLVNGPAYPNERRLPLRAPAPLLLGLLPLVWAVALAPMIAGPLLLAARQWVAGGAVLVLGLPLAALLVRAIHGLSRRWLVFVPAGVVLHDPMALTDPVLFRRELIAELGPAPADTTALDLTQAAPGLALELRLKEEVPILRSKPGRRLGEPVSPSRLLFTPTRPGAVLQEAEERGLTVS